MLLEDRLRLLAERDHPPQIVVVALPADVIRRCGAVDYIDPTLGQVHRDLRRAFKATAMEYRIPTQLVDPTTIQGKDDDHPSRTARDLPDRQRTMRATIERSYQLLEEPEGRLLNRLSVFRGGWDLAAAEAVGAGEALSEEEVLPLLSSLVEQSLVMAEAGGDGPTRCRMLVPVGEYAEERLEESGETEATRRRHAAYFLALAEQVEPQGSGSDAGVWLRRLNAEHDNLRTALAWCLEDDPLIVVRFGDVAHAAGPVLLADGGGDLGSTAFHVIAVIPIEPAWRSPSCPVCSDAEPSTRVASAARKRDTARSARHERACRRT